MNKILVGTASISGALMLLVAVSSRRVRDLSGYARATADTTVTELESSLPDTVRDQKVLNQLDDARGELIDRRVSLNLTTGQIRDLQDEIARLTAAIARRETILSDAWPAMEAAAADRTQPVSFSGTQWQPAELGAEVDRLLNEQDRDEAQLNVRSETLARLQASVKESQQAVTEMDSQLQKAESDFDMLRLRRQQAQSESELLDLLSAAGQEGATAGGQLAADLSNIEKQVRDKEARNSARRDSAPLSDARPSRLTQSYERLERLKSLHQQRCPQTSDAPTHPTPPAASTDSGPTTPPAVPSNATPAIPDTAPTTGASESVSSQ